MENQQIADTLEETAKLMELHGENPFKIKSYVNAASKIEKSAVQLQGKTMEELEQLDGIGKSLSHKIYTLIEIGTFPELR